VLKESKDKKSFSPSSTVKKVRMKYSLLPFRKMGPHWVGPYSVNFTH
jgi:hypothetical protein